MTIDQMRKDYLLAGLRKRDVDQDPMVQFQKWFHESLQPDLPDWFEVNAMTLSTSDQYGRVSSRVVLLKGIDDGRLLFFTNYDSDKGQQIAENPHVSLCFFWPHLQRQVRIEGSVHRTSRERSEHYFHSRPRDSQVGALVSQQSSVVASRDILEARRQEVEAEHGDDEIPCPENWGGYQVEPERFEFWQGRSGRLHDRILYERDGEQWKCSRLSP